MSPTRALGYAVVFLVATAGWGCAITNDVSGDVEQARAELAARQALPDPDRTPQEVVQIQVDALSRDEASRRALLTARQRDDSIQVALDSLVAVRDQLRAQGGSSPRAERGEDLPARAVGGGVEADGGASSNGPTPLQQVDQEISQIIHVMNNGPSYSHAGEGVKQAYEFLTPVLKYQIGPPRRWRGVVESPTYRYLVLHTEATYDPPLVRGDKAMQRVVLRMPDGGETAYIFKLQREVDEEYEPCAAGCWMTAEIIQEYPVEYGPEGGPKTARQPVR